VGTGAAPSRLELQRCKLPVIDRAPVLARAPISRSDAMSPSILRLLSLVALGAVLPLVGLYALLISISIPNATGGMEPIMATICYVAFTCIFGVMITVAINFSRQLSRESKGAYTLP
jgi:hypothetical protein